MKNLTLLFLFLLGTSTIFGQHPFPTYDSVYQQVKRCAGSKFNVETISKKKEGWFAETNYKNIEGDVQIWDAASGKFTCNASYGPQPLTNYDHIILKNNEIFNYLEYYGYEGWEDDIIKDLANNKSFTANQLFSLCFAYGVKSKKLNENDKGDFISFHSNKELSKDELKEFIELRKLTHQYGDLLLAEHPDYRFKSELFQTIFGMEQVFTMITLDQYLSEKKIQKLIRTDLFDNFYLSHAQRLLSEANKESIFVVKNDIEFGSLFYYQQVNNFRKDVAVVYFNDLSKYGQAKRLKDQHSINGSFNLEEFQSMEKIRVTFRGSGDLQTMSSEIASIKSALPAMNNNRIKLENSKYYFCYQSDSIAVKHSYSWDVKDIVIHDLIDNNNQRSFYFSDLYKRINKELFDDQYGYFQLKENFDLVIWNKHPFMSNKYLHEKANKLEFNIPNKPSASQRYILRKHQQTLTALATRHQKQKELEDAEKITKLSLKHFPENITPSYVFGMKYAEILYQAGNSELASQIGIKVLDALEKDKIYIGSGTYEKQYNEYAKSLYRYSDFYKVYAMHDLLLEKGIVYDGMFVPFEEDGKWGFKTKNNTVVIPNEYDCSGTFHDKLAIIGKDGKFGLIDRTNKVIVPFEYEKLKHTSVGFITTKNEKYGMLNKHGREVIPTQYDNLKLEDHSGAYVVVELNNKYGVYKVTDYWGTNSFREMIPVEYDLINYSNFFFCYTGKKGDTPYWFERSGRAVEGVPSDQEVEIVEMEVEEEVVMHDEIYDFAEKKAEFPGGVEAMMKFISDNIKYPKQAKKENIQGTVYVKFVVNQQGYFEQITLVRKVNPLLDEEALRVLKMMPKWKPAEQRGKKVKSWYTLPIKFKLK